MLRVTEYFAKTLKVIRNGTIRKFRYGFLFTLYSNYGSTLQFRGEVKYWSKIGIFSYPSCIWCNIKGVPIGILPYCVAIQWWKVRGYV